MPPLSRRAWPLPASLALAAGLAATVVAPGAPTASAQTVEFKTVEFKTVEVKTVEVKAAPAVLSGTWLTADGSSKIQFDPCGTRVCGRIAWIKEPIDKDTGQPVKDKNNPEPALKSKPLVGITLLRDLKAADPHVWEGTVYNPQDGGVYDVSITLSDADHLVLQGCLFAFLCQSEIWTRVPEPASAPVVK